MDYSPAVPHHFRLHDNAPTHQARTKTEHHRAGGTSDALGRVATATLDAGGGTVTLASNIQYLPFGPIVSLTLHNRS